MQINAINCIQMMQVKMLVRNATLYRNIIATYVALFFTFIFIIISPSSRHVMLIDRVVIHPGWQLQFKVVDSTAIVILFPLPLQHATWHARSN